MSRRRLTSLVLGAVIAVLAAGSTHEALAQMRDGKPLVRIGYSERPDAVLILAEKLGYFAEQGLATEVVTGGKRTEDFLQMISSGQLDVLTGSVNAALFNSLNRNIDIRIVAASAIVGPKTDHSFSLVERKALRDSGAVKKISDLKSRTIAIGPGRGSYNEYFAVKLLAAGGLTPNDVDVKYLPFQDGFAALANKAVDAALLIEPMVTFAIAENVGDILVGVGEIDEGAQLSMVYYSPDFAKRIEVGNKFMIAFIKAQRAFSDAFFENKNTDAVIDVLSKSMPPKDPAVWKQFQAAYRELNGELNIESLRKQAEFYRQTGTLKGAVPVIEKYVDPTFVRAAQQALGRR